MYKQYHYKHALNKGLAFIWKTGINKGHPQLWKKWKIGILYDESESN